MELTATTTLDPAAHGSAVPHATHTARLLASFRTGGTLFALDAASVQEVIRFRKPTPIRHAPPAVLGVINLRGRIVTVLNLGLILGMGAGNHGPNSRIFILENRGEFVGLLVEEVGDVMESDASRLAAIPANVPASQARFLHGVYRDDGRIIAVLNAGEVLAPGRS